MPQINMTAHETSVTLDAPYVAGHVMNEAEAYVLNQTWLENVRNNTGPRVKKARETDPNADVAAIILEYAKTYVFNLRTASTAVKRTVDPVEREARVIAKELIRKKVEASNAKLKDIDKDKLEAKIAEVAARPEVLEQAKKVISARNKASSALGDIEV